MLTIKMISLMRYCENNIVQRSSAITRLSSFSSSINVEEEFRVLELLPKKEGPLKRRMQQFQAPKIQPQEETMLTDQNWQTVWPTARTFHPAIVPLPIRQGYKHNKRPHPDKYANTELMKIPNFLHLTPPTIRAHCKELKRFCTKWPKELETDAACEKYFPVEITTSDYCYSSPTIREPLARIVTLSVKLSSLNLDTHAKDKMLRLVGKKYNPSTNKLTIIADRCPSRKQNLDYVNYLLTALFHICWRVEPWESEKYEADMEYYDWDKSKSKKNLVTIVCWPKPPTDFNYEDIPHATEYKVAISELINNGEDHYTLNKYKQAVKKLLNLNDTEDVE